MRLGAYKGLEVKAADLTVQEKELERMVRNTQRKNAVIYHIDERPAQDGDVVFVNYEGHVQGSPYRGGKAVHHRMVLGEHKGLPGFEEQIVGHTMGEQFEICVSVPVEHANEQIAGLDVVFSVHLLVVGREEIPPFDDAFAQDFSTFDTAEELLDSFRVMLTSKKEGAEEQRIQEELLTHIIDDSQIPVADTLLDELQEEVLDEKIEDLEAQGMTIDQFLETSQQTFGEFQIQCRKQALRQYQETTVLYEIAMREGMDVTEEELENALYELAFFEELNEESVEEELDEAELSGIRLQIMCEKAMDFVKQEARYV